MALDLSIPVFPFAPDWSDLVRERVTVRFGMPLELSHHGPANSGRARRLATDDIMRAIHDLSGDLVAMCDLNGPGGAARVVGQWTYEPYGGVLTAEYPVLGAQPPPRS